jgi:hypothetical protein
MASMGNAQRGALGGLAKLGEGARTTSDLSRVGGGLSRGANEGKKLNAAPWSDTWPAAGATLDLDFANNRGFVRGVGQGGVMDAITFTRASVGRFVGEDGLLQEADNGEPRFDWASTEQVARRNLLRFTEEFDNSVWSKLNSTISANTTETTDPIGGNSADKFLATSTTAAFQVFTPPTGSTGIVGETYTISVYAKAAEYTWIKMGMSGGNGGVNFDLVNGVIGTVDSLVSNESIVSVGNGWYRCSLTIASWASNQKVIFVLALADNVVTFAGDATSGIYLWGAQFENGDTLTNYQAIAQATSTTPLRANPTSNGILIEEARTNRLLWNRDATQTQWVKTNITAVKDQTGIDGVANAASSLTATDDNGTCIQTITLAAGNRTGSVYLKRLTGTGNIQVTLDGSTYSTVDLSDTEWYRIVLSGSVTNPTVGIKIAVDGDAVAMDYGQVEDGLFVTSPILTTTATATRALDLAVNTIADQWLNQSGGTILVNFSNTLLRQNTQFSTICGLGSSTVDGNFYGIVRYRNDNSINQNNPVGIDILGENKVSVSFGLENTDEKSAINGSATNDNTLSITGVKTEYGRLGIGSSGRLSNPAGANTTIKRIVYFPKQTTINALEAITG